MHAVLYIAHGSRVQAGIDEAKNFIETVKPFIEAPIQEMCFLELASPSIKEGIEVCIKRGAKSIAVIPILLLSANHAKQDIPEEIASVMKHHPNVTVTIGKPFGIHENLIETIHERVMEKVINRDEEISLLLVGRGSSDPSVQKDLSQIANEVKRKYEYKKVDTCFLYGSGPPFEGALQKLSKEKPLHRVYIVPYLLFTGLLKIGIQKKISEQFSNGEVILCESLGYNEKVRDVLIERVNETLYQIQGGI